MDAFLFELEPSAQKHVRTEIQDPSLDMKGTLFEVQMMGYATLLVGRVN